MIVRRRPNGFGLLDEQLGRFSEQLRAAVGLSDDEVNKVSTLVATEVRFLDAASKQQIHAASPVPLAARLDELRAFQMWMEIAANIQGHPAVTRAQVITQNYVSFVYLGEACFQVLRKVSGAKSVTHRCCSFLTDNPVRAFCNAIAHSNWSYRSDFGGLVFWARKGSVPDEPLTEFEVSQDELNFWQTLSRGVAYAAYTSLESVAG